MVELKRGRGKERRRKRGRRIWNRTLY